MSSVDEHVLAKPILSRGSLLILLAAVLWSFAGVFIKSLELHPLVITFYRSFFAPLSLFLFVTRGESLDLHTGRSVVRGKGMEWHYLWTVTE